MTINAIRSGLQNTLTRLANPAPTPADAADPRLNDTQKAGLASQEWGVLTSCRLVTSGVPPQAAITTVSPCTLPARATGATTPWPQSDGSRDLGVA